MCLGMGGLLASCWQTNDHVEIRPLAFELKVVPFLPELTAVISSRMSCSVWVTVEWALTAGRNC